MTIYLGADHKGYHLKGQLFEYLKKHGYKVQDVGSAELDPDDDFPEFAARVVSAIKISNDRDPRGILICGSGQGMAMAANRFKGIYATLGWNKQSARESRDEDNSNVLCIPAKHVNEKEMKLIVEVWLNTPFDSAARRVRRLRQIDQL